MVAAREPAPPSACRAQGPSHGATASATPGHSQQRQGSQHRAGSPVARPSRQSGAGGAQSHQSRRTPTQRSASPSATNTPPKDRPPRINTRNRRP